MIGSFVGLAGLVGLVGCANNPVYLPAPMTMEAGIVDPMGVLSEARSSLQLPIKTETSFDLGSGPSWPPRSIR